MHRSVGLPLAAVITIGLCYGCGRPTKPDFNLAVTDVSATGVSAPKAPAPQLVHGRAFLGAEGDEIPFTLLLPPAWSWSGVQADKTAALPVTSSLSLTANQLPDDEKAEPPRAAARRRLEELADGRMLSDLASGEKITIRDRRLIQVGESDAVWDVVAFQADDKTLPTRLEARCHLKLGDKQFTIEGRYFDERGIRSADDFDAAQAEFLTITRSFRIEHIDAGSTR